MAAHHEGTIVQNGEMAVRITCDVKDASDLWCIHHDLDWPRVLRDALVGTIQAHLPRGIALRVVVDVVGGEVRRR